MVQNNTRNNSTYWRDHRAAAALDELRAAKTTQFFPLPACQDFICDSTGISLKPRKYAHAQKRTPEYEFRAYLQKNAMTGQTRFMIAGLSAYRSASAGHTDGSRTFVVKLSHGQASHPSYANDDAALRMHRNRLFQ
jgi:hypothetical protein